MSAVAHRSLSEFLNLHLPNLPFEDLSHEVYGDIGNLNVPIIQLQGSAVSSVLTDLNGLSLIGFKQVHSVFNDTYCLSQGLVIWVSSVEIGDVKTEGYWKPFTTFEFSELTYTEWCDSLERSISLVLDTL